MKFYNVENRWNDFILGKKFVKLQMVSYEGLLEMQLELIVKSPLFRKKEEGFYKKYYEIKRNVRKAEKALKYKLRRNGGL